MRLRIDRNSTIVRGSLFSIFSFFNKGLNFLLLIVIANFLTPEAYGELSLFTTLVTVLGFFMCFSGEGYMPVAYFKQDKEEFRKVLSSVLAIPLGVLLLLGAVTVLLLPFTERLFGLAITDVFFALLIAFFTVYVNVCLDYFRIQEKIVTYGKVSCSYALLNFLFTILFIAVLKWGWQGRVFSLLFCAFIYTLIAFRVFTKDRQFIPSGISKESVRTVILWGLPLIPHLASAWIRQGGDRYIINGFYDLGDVGIFSFALNLVSIITMVGVAFNASNSVDVYKSLSEQKDNMLVRARSYIRKMLLLYAALCLGITLVCALLIPCLVPQYKGALVYFYILVPYGFLQCCYFLYCNYLFYYGKNKQIMNITFITSILHLALSFALTRYSLLATAVVYTVTQTIVLVLLRFRVKATLKEKLPQYAPDWIL